MTIFITGASGFIGSHVMRTLQAAGYDVVGLSRNAQDASHFQRVDYRELGDVFANAKWVLHFADEARRGADAYEADTLAKAVVEATPSAANLIFTSSVYARLDRASESYGAKKRAAEKVFREARSDTIILRLPPVYGDGAKGGIATLENLVKSGFPLPFGRAEAKRDYLAIKNLCDLILHILTAPDAAFGESFEPSDGAPISTRDLCRDIASVIGLKSRLVPVHLSFLSFVGTITGKAPMIDAALSPLLVEAPEKLKHKLGWTPKMQMPETLYYMKD